MSSEFKTTYSFLYPGEFHLDGGSMFGIIPKPLWETRIAADSHNRIPMGTRCWLISTEDRHILVEVGTGDYHGEKWDQRFCAEGTHRKWSQMLEASHGIGPNEITDVILTHLHFDHAGGLLKNPQELNFPNANFHIHQKHWEYAQDPTLRDAGSFHKKHLTSFFKLAENKIKWIHNEEGELLNTGTLKISFRCYHGHTPYQVLPYTDKYVFLGDTVPTSHHIDYPWVMGYDLHPGESTKDRLDLYQWMNSNNLIGIFDHDLTSWGGLLDLTNQKPTWKELFQSQPIDGFERLPS